MRVFKVVLSAFFLFVMIPVKTVMAHEVNSATVLVHEVKPGQFICRVMTPLVKLDQAVRAAKLGSGDLTFGTDAYKGAVVEYVRANLHVVPRALSSGYVGRPLAKLEFGSAGLKLNNHQTDIIFEILNYPDAPFEAFDLDVQLMVGNARQTNGFRYISGHDHGGLTLRRAQEFKGRFLKTQPIFVCGAGIRTTQTGCGG